ncbi:metallophosphoesterase family protein [Jannaschia rubra]|uniref:metallophosphoesterase family protein n=1 Tax=Jannaschia rubra TaxID=282197 RepID=UPI0024936F0D|nr:metallophosphoesterase family protein [Jannaschia rubra]
MSRLARRPTRTQGAPRPEGRIYAVGDIHGRHDLLEEALDLIAADRARHDDAGTLVFLGDYIDRGDHAAEVLATLRALPGPVVTLMGNHERMMLDFLRDPDRYGRRWLGNGGVQTLASFGVVPPADPTAPGAMATTARALRKAMASGTIDWLEGLPTLWRSGNLIFVHAGLDPDLPPEAQEEAAFLWGHPAFLRTPRQDGLWVVHGHTIVEQPEARGGRVALDSGAWITDRLTVGVLLQAGVSFLTATAD